MVGADDVRKPGGVQGADILAAGQFRNEVEDANATAFFRRNAGEFAESDESRGIDAGQGDISNDKRPLGGFQVGEEKLRVGNEAQAPALGIAELATGDALGLILGV